MGDTDGTDKRGTGKRRRFTKEFRRQVVQETCAPGASIAGVALKHRLNANLVFTWRRKLMASLAPTRSRSAKLLPVTIADPSAAVPTDEPIGSSKRVRRYRTRGVIEIELNGARVVLKGVVDAEALRVVLAALASR